MSVSQPGSRWIVAAATLGLVALAPAARGQVPPTPPAVEAMGPTDATPSAEDIVAGDIPRAISATAPEEALRPPVTRLLNRVLGLEDSPVKLFGWIQNSFTGNTNGTPPSGTNFGVYPNHLADQWQGNQYYLIAENALEGGDEIDLGFRTDFLFGNDWQFTKSYGLFDRAFRPNSFAGIDFPQIHGDLHLPVLTEWGLDVRGGRFYSLAGFEGAQAINRPLLSVPYALNFTPFTFLGTYGTLHLKEDNKADLFLGTVNGWDRWFDQSYRWNVLGGFLLGDQSGRTTLTFEFVIGPNQLPRFPPADSPFVPTGLKVIPGLAGRVNPGYATNPRSYFSTTLTHRWTDRITQAVQTDQVLDKNNPGFGPGLGPRDTGWYSLVHWLLVGLDGPIDDARATAVYRAEMFQDPQGAATGVPGTYYEMTVGLLTKPRPWLWFRPEARYDWASGSTPFNDGTRSSQLTLAFDVIVLF